MLENNCKCSKKISKENRISLVADNIRKIELKENIKENINGVIELLEYFNDITKEDLQKLDSKYRLSSSLVNLNITLLKQSIRDLYEIN